MNGADLQLDAQGRLRHFLSIEGMRRAQLEEILQLAESFIGVGEQQVKKVPLLRGKTVVNLFFENSTRTPPRPCWTCSPSAITRAPFTT